MRIAVLMGGTSTERDVSLASGSTVVRSLRENGHSVAALDLPQAAASAASEPAELYAAAGHAAPALAVATTPPSLAELAALERELGGVRLARGLLEVCAAADLAFLALHGGSGEDGRIQALLEVGGVPHTGAAYLGCALAFNKPVSKRLMRDAGIATPAWQVLRGADDAAPPDGFPLIVKPARGGSTVGVSIVRSHEELDAAVRSTLELGPEALVERFVDGREFTVAVLGGAPLPVIEIAGAGAVFDYRAKYQPGGAQELCPAPIPAPQAAVLQELALAVHDTLGLGPHAYSRVDFRVGADGQPQCLEANVLPGLTMGSLLPLAARTAGIDHPALCARIVELAPGRA